MSTDPVIMTLQIGQQRACLPAQSMLSFRSMLEDITACVYYGFASREGLAIDAYCFGGPVNRP